MSEQQIFAKCAWRLIPFMMLLYLVNYIDRVNVGFAALTMNRDLGFSPAVYGFGAGVFFFGYCIFHVPANVILHRVGARRTVFCILAAWGAFSAGCALVQGPLTFYILRFFLGIAEAGLVPGMLLYLTYWFPKNYRARYTAAFQSAIPFAFVIGGPISGLILDMDGIGGILGWQWLFLLEGLPAVLLAFVALKLLPDGPAHASWLSSDEKALISTRLAAEVDTKDPGLLPALLDPRIFALGLVLFGLVCTIFGIQLWLPQIVQAMGFSNRATGFLMALPGAMAIGAMMLWGRSSDKSGDRVWHIALAMVFTAVSLIVAGFAQADVVVLVALGFAFVGPLAALPILNSLPGLFLGGRAAAGGIALYLSIGNLGGFAGPYIVGALKGESGNYRSGMAALAFGLLLSALLVVTLRRALAPRPAILMPRAGVVG
jgi:ACS family tartrate transporter-like MFS transporter